MQREHIAQRPDWSEKLNQLGLEYCIGEEATSYWSEGVCYSFTLQEIEELEAATQTLHVMALEAVDHVIATKQYERFGIPAAYIPLIERSWAERHPFIYGRFDLAYDGVNPPKMLEYNADTPTTLPEAAVVQWNWLNDHMEAGHLSGDADQFNSIHESLIEAWARTKKEVCIPEPIYFTTPYLITDGVICNKEDVLNLRYMRDVCQQAGIKATEIDLVDIGWNGASFTDLQERRIGALYKLYPWEMFWDDKFGIHLTDNRTGLIEPAWKMLLSNKALLAVMWEMFPDHPNLLPAFQDENKMRAYLAERGEKLNYVKKPILGREGSNVTFIEDGQTAASTPGNYGKEGFVYQTYFDLPAFDGNVPVIGSWVSGGHAEPGNGMPTHPRGGKACGIGIREGGRVTNDQSRFVPHYIQAPALEGPR